MKYQLTLKEIIYLICVVMCCFTFISPAIALLMGLLSALIFGSIFSGFSKSVSKYLLQASVVGLGFGMNVFSALKSGKEGFIFTLFTVALVMIVGFFIGKKLKLSAKISYLISSGTAICGGSAIAAVAPIIKAKQNEIVVAIATIFTLNAIALFLFPVVGHLLNMTQHQFGIWAAIAIHDTSSVVGAGAAYGEIALQTATTVKLTRALWIIPLSLATSFLFKNDSKKIYLPYFILFFIIAMCVNTFMPIPEKLNSLILFISKRALCITLFMIGTGFSVSAIKEVGAKPLILGVVLWFLISAVSLFVILI